MPADLRIFTLLNSSLELLAQACELLDSGDQQMTDLHLRVIAAYNRTAESIAMAELLAASSDGLKKFELHLVKRDG